VLSAVNREFKSTMTVFQVIYDLKKFETEKCSVTQCSIDNNFGMKRKTLDYILHETHYYDSHAKMHVLY
jgi:hypothetical protein